MQLRDIVAPTSKFHDDRGGLTRGHWSPWRSDGIRLLHPTRYLFIQGAVGLMHKGLGNSSQRFNDSVDKGCVDPPIVHPCAGDCMRAEMK